MIFGTREGTTIIFPGTGTGGWESALTNTLSPGDKVGMQCKCNVVRASSVRRPAGLGRQLWSCFCRAAKGARAHLVIHASRHSSIGLNLPTHQPLTANRRW